MGREGGRLEGEGVADPGYHGQGPYSNSTIPLKCASGWNCWHGGGTGEVGLDFFLIFFFVGGRGSGSGLVQETNNPE